MAPQNRPLGAAEMAPQLLVLGCHTWVACEIGPKFQPQDACSVFILWCTFQCKSLSGYSMVAPTRLMEGRAVAEKPLSQMFRAATAGLLMQWAPNWRRGAGLQPAPELM